MNSDVLLSGSYGLHDLYFIKFYQAKKLRKWGSDLSAFLEKRHELLCDVDEKSLLSFLQLAQFCLQCDFTIESNEVLFPIKFNH